MSVVQIVGASLAIVAGEVKGTFPASSKRVSVFLRILEFYLSESCRAQLWPINRWESFHTLLIRFAEDASGATAIEYGLIAAIVGVGIIVGLTQLQSGLNTLFGNINTQLTK